MNIQRFIVGPLLTNSYLIICEKTNESVLIDPGDVSKELLENVKEHSLKAILLTHGHFDHIAGVNTILDAIDVPVFIHSLDVPMLTDPVLNGSYMIGTDISFHGKPEILSAGDDVIFGESSLKIIHTPGHSEGGVSFVSDGEFIVAGDTLFKLSVGRWDLPGGNYSTLMKTLMDVFSTMPVSTEVYPGHGETTHIGFEKEYNQFMRDL